MCIAICRWGLLMEKILCLLAYIFSANNHEQNSKESLPMISDISELYIYGYSQTIQRQRQKTASTYQQGKKNSVCIPTCSLTAALNSLYLLHLAY